MSDYTSDVAPRTVRIHQNGSARLSSDLVPDGAEWLSINVGKDRHRVFLRITMKPEADSIKLDFHRGRRRSPLFWFRPWLFELGIVTSEAVGIYSVVRRGPDAVVIDLKKPLRWQAGRLQIARGKPAKNPYRPGSARFRAFRKCCRSKGATVAEIAKIAEELGVKLDPLLRSMRSQSVHGYKVSVGPRNSIKLTPP
jgi:hypothetical protein